MSKKAALLTVHGMGRTDDNYNQEFLAELRNTLGDKFEQLHIGTVNYQKILQPNEDIVWGKMGKQVRWDPVRKFLLFGFADAAGLETNKESLNSVYSLAQINIVQNLLEAKKAIGPKGKVIIIAQSLGCQVTSCYFWDAQQHKLNNDVKHGIWQNIKKVENKITQSNEPLSDEDIAFLRGDTFTIFFTTGCNIPIFVAAHATVDILPFNKPSENFAWHNFYDKDDVLGWPLAGLSEQYKIVVDHPINASGGGFIGWLMKSWNPAAHLQYWTDDDVIKPLADELKKILT